VVDIINDYAQFISNDAFQNGLTSLMTSPTGTTNPAQLTYFSEMGNVFGIDQRYMSMANAMVAMTPLLTLSLLTGSYFAMSQLAKGMTSDQSLNKAQDVATPNLGATNYNQNAVGYGIYNTEHGESMNMGQVSKGNMGTLNYGSQLSSGITAQSTIANTQAAGADASFNSAATAAAGARHDFSHYADSGDKGAAKISDALNSEHKFAGQVASKAGISTASAEKFMMGVSGQADAGASPLNAIKSELGTMARSGEQGMADASALAGQFGFKIGAKGTVSADNSTTHTGAIEKHAADTVSNALAMKHDIGKAQEWTEAHGVKSSAVDSLAQNYQNGVAQSVKSNEAFQKAQTLQGNLAETQAAGDALVATFPGFMAGQSEYAQKTNQTQMRAAEALASQIRGIGGSTAKNFGRHLAAETASGANPMMAINKAAWLTAQQDPEAAAPIMAQYNGGQTENSKNTALDTNGDKNLMKRASAISNANTAGTAAVQAHTPPITTNPSSPLESDIPTAQQGAQTASAAEQQVNARMASINSKYNELKGPQLAAFKKQQAAAIAAYQAEVAAVGASTGAARAANEKKMIETAAVATILGVGSGVIGAVAAKAAAPLVVRTLQRMTGATPEPPRTLSDAKAPDAGPYKPGTSPTGPRSQYTGAPVEPETTPATTGATPGASTGIKTTPISDLSDLSSLGSEGGSVTLGMVSDVASRANEALFAVYSSDAGNPNGSPLDRSDIGKPITLKERGLNAAGNPAVTPRLPGDIVQ
jgi:hypothetical protein